MTRIVAGQSAPLFSLENLGGGLTSLASTLERGPVVLAFFKITCPVCQFTFPFLERIHLAFKGQATVLAVSQDDARDTADFMSEYKLSFSILLDEDSYPISNEYGLTNVPTLFLLNSRGKVLVSSLGFVRADLEAIWKTLADQVPHAPAGLFYPDEVIPSYKPG